jgi:2,4-dienoyl-CoA reductase-like NADH-dependent reductase (Old Yellow Enzyme family)
MSRLFSPIMIRDLVVKNRIWIAPMCQYACTGSDGIVTQWHLAHYGQRAIGGAGLIIAEATAVTPEGRISAWDSGLWSDDQIEPWLEVTEFVKAQGARFGVQLAHAGRKASTYPDWVKSGSMLEADGGWQPVGPGSEAFEGYVAPRELTTAEVAEFAQKFASAAERAVRAGFEFVEIHAAHGYLLHEFLSPGTNHRSDQFGGSLENRARLLLDVVRAVRATVPNEMPIFVRFSASDWADTGWNEEEAATVAEWCIELGVDLIDVSSGGLLAGVKIPVGPGYQVPLAEHIAHKVGKPVAAVGLITEAKQAEQILESGEVSVILIGRAALRDPFWPLRAAAELGVDTIWPVRYQRAKFN